MGSAEAMVTARMAADKKEEGNRVLAALGTNASKVVNQLYDYIIKEQELPFEKLATARSSYSKAEIASAVAFVDGLIAPVASEYQGMSLKEARLARLGITSKEAEEL